MGRLGLTAWKTRQGDSSGGVVVCRRGTRFAGRFASLGTAHLSGFEPRHERTATHVRT